MEINQRMCRACAKCCKHFTISYSKEQHFTISYSKELMKTDRVLFSELQRYLDLKTLSIYVIEVKDSFLVVFDFPCVKLIKRGSDYTCSIYSGNRPELCKVYPQDGKCEKFDNIINTFRDSDAFLKRVKELGGGI